MTGTSFENKHVTIDDINSQSSVQSCFYSASEITNSNLVYKGKNETTTIGKHV